MFTKNRKEKIFACTLSALMVMTPVVQATDIQPSSTQPSAIESVANNEDTPNESTPTESAQPVISTEGTTNEDDTEYNRLANSVSSLLESIRRESASTPNEDTLTRGNEENALNKPDSNTDNTLTPGSGFRNAPDTTSTVVDSGAGSMVWLEGNGQRVTKRQTVTPHDVEPIVLTKPTSIIGSSYAPKIKNEYTFEKPIVYFDEIEFSGFESDVEANENLITSLHILTCLLRLKMTRLSRQIICL